MQNKKLIEVALPLEKINEASAREKSIRQGHPSTLHLWWARRPLATARAVIWASIVDDPSSHPDIYVTEEEQNKERQRLFAILERLVVWENSNDIELLEEAKNEMLKSNNNVMPEFLDPFSGGGAIPLEAQRLGLKVHAHDLNPVAVMINKAMLEIVPRFLNSDAVNRIDRVNILNGSYGPHGGLAKDIAYYGQLLKNHAYSVVGTNYPKVKAENEKSGDAVPIAWIWARTVKCPNPLCGCKMPLARSFDLYKKKGKEKYVDIEIHDGKAKYIVKSGKSPREGTVNRKGATCVFCGSPVSFPYIREESASGRMGADLMAIVAEGEKKRLYLSPDAEQEYAAKVDKPTDYPEGELAFYPGHLNTKIYGLTEFHQLFSNRQLATLVCLSDGLEEIKRLIEKDAVDVGMNNDHIPLEQGGNGARAYADAIVVFLAFAIDRESDICSSIASWINTIGAVRNTFARQAIPMVWDYAEVNPFSSSAGCFDNMLSWIVKVVEGLPIGIEAEVSQQDAQSPSSLENVMVSTDPPYYDNIGYADLSDYFYVWMRRSLKDVYPSVFSTLLVPKKEELVAIQYRFDGDKKQAKAFFEDGMFTTFKQVNSMASNDIPVTIYYAFKQSESETIDSEQKTASSGWETILSAIVRAGFEITGTWPMRTEREVRTIASNSNALASSIILVCRKRNSEVQQITRRNFINMLKRELKPALKKLQSSNIAPVDLAQSAIGPGIGVYSRYNNVLEADGTFMSVRSALQIINQEIDIYFNEQDGELDRESRFCVDLFSQFAFNTVKFGDADTLARAKNTSVESMAAKGLVYAQKGNVHLLDRNEISEKIDDNSSIWLLCQQLTKAMELGGIEKCAKSIALMFGSAPENAKDLAYRLFTIAERKGWAQEAYAYNALVVSWPDIQSRAAAMRQAVPEQMSFMDLLDNN